MSLKIGVAFTGMSHHEVCEGHEGWKNNLETMSDFHDLVPS